MTFYLQSDSTVPMLQPEGQLSYCAIGTLFSEKLRAAVIISLTTKMMYVPKMMSRHHRVTTRVIKERGEPNPGCVTLDPQTRAQVPYCNLVRSPFIKKL